MKILFIGDVMLGRLVNAVLKHKPPTYPWGDTLAIFQTADFRICNLECVISDKGSPWSMTKKVFHFRTDSKNIGVLKAANINAVSLANNHTLDYGYEAMFEMLDILEKAGIWYAGAGKDFSQASAGITVEIIKEEKTRSDRQHLRIGMISFTDNEPNWEAGRNKPGIFYVPVNLKDEKAKLLLQMVHRAKSNVDILIISAHWGPNWGYEPSKEHRKFAYALIEAGADIIYGHSPHVFRGIEIYNEGIILYSTGDFIDDYAVDEIERNDESFIFITNVNEKRIESLTLYPVIIENMQANLAKNYDAERIVSKMKNLSEKLGTESMSVDESKLKIALT